MTLVGAGPSRSHFLPPSQGEGCVNHLGILSPGRSWFSRSGIWGEPEILHFQHAPRLLARSAHLEGQGLGALRGAFQLGSRHCFWLPGSVFLCPGPQGLTLLLERSVSISYLYPEGTSPSLCLGRGAGLHQQRQNHQDQGRAAGGWRGGTLTGPWTLICFWPHCVVPPSPPAPQLYDERGCACL